MWKLNHGILLAGLFCWFLFCLPSHIFSAEATEEPLPSPNLTKRELLPPSDETLNELPQLYNGKLNAQIQTPSSPNLEQAWAQLKNDWLEQEADLQTLLKQLSELRTEIEETRRLSMGLTARCASLELLIKTERKGAEAAIRTSLEREAKAIRMKNIWKGVGITCGLTATTILVIEYGPDIVEWFIRLLS